MSGLIAPDSSSTKFVAMAHLCMVEAIDITTAMVETQMESLASNGEGVVNGSAQDAAFIRGAACSVCEFAN
jgi:hypothetical protein